MHEESLITTPSVLDGTLREPIAHLFRCFLDWGHGDVEILSAEEGVDLVGMFLEDVLADDGVYAIAADDCVYRGGVAVGECQV